MSNPREMTAQKDHRCAAVEAGAVRLRARGGWILIAE